MSYYSEHLGEDTTVTFRSRRAYRPLTADQVDTSVQLTENLILANPILTASGTFASGREVNRFFNVNELGAVVVKSMTIEPRPGLPTPRMAETASGMLNAIGLQNPGIQHWLENDYQWMLAHNIPIIASIAGRTAHEFRLAAEKLRGLEGIVAIEANISCPNVENRNIVFSCTEGPTAEVIHTVTRASTVPVFAKLTPDVTDITAIAGAAYQAGAAGVSVINTTLGLSIDVNTHKPRLAAVTGGLSGPAVKPIALRCVYQIHQAFPEFPIIGMGGARSVEDVVEFLLAGASAVAIGTATFTNPLLTKEIVDQLPLWLAERNINSVQELTGAIDVS